MGRMSDVAIEKKLSFEAPSQERSGFVTGSRAYGTPREDSDIDLVVLITEQQLGKLVASCAIGETKNTTYNGDKTILRFGRLNLFCMTSFVRYDLWKKGTDELIARRPVTRQEAKDLFIKLEKAAGFVDNDGTEKPETGDPEL